MSNTLATGNAAASSGMASLASVALSLALVVGLVVLLGWLLARVRGLGPGGGQGPLRVAASLPLGLKERVLLVEAAGAWLLVAVTPGKVRLLHTYASRPEGLDVAPAPAGFGAVLDRLRRPGGTP
jgi:flagellar protein FliO/FliZ